MLILDITPFTHISKVSNLLTPKAQCFMIMRLGGNVITWQKKKFFSFYTKTKPDLLCAEFHLECIFSRQHQREKTLFLKVSRYKQEKKASNVKWQSYRERHCTVVDRN